jgi:RimJ/RimL family protein N-acetyltransferase
MSTFFFYQGTPETAGRRRCLAPEYELEIWRSSWSKLRPAKLPIMPFSFWSLMSMFGLFANNCYAVLLIRRGSQLVHRSTITPRYFRFPFMEESDLQIGDTWTAQEDRGRGLAGAAIQEILRRDTDSNRTYWYIVEADNAASIRVIEKAGFHRVGKGIRTPRFGLRILGAFRISQPASADLMFNK